MASTNGSGRPPGCVSIPVEIIRNSNPTNPNSHSRHNSPFRTFHNDNGHGSFSDSPPWNSGMNPNPSQPRFQPRQSPSAAYDRVITNSQFNQPLNDRYSHQQVQDPQFPPSQQRTQNPIQPHFSRSNEDLLASPFDSMRYSAQPQFTSLIPPSFGSGLQRESDFVQANKFSSPLRRSFDALNDFSDMHPSFPITRPYPPEQQRQQEQQQQQQPYYRSTYQTQHQPQQQPQQQQPIYTNQTFLNPNIVYLNEFGVPTDHYQPNAFHEPGHFVNERSRSPAAQRGASPARPQAPQSAQPPPQQQQQQQPFPDEPELKMAKDSDGPIPMPAPASFTPQSMDQQVPSADTPAPNHPATAPAPEPSTDPNTIAIEKLEQIKRILDDLEQQVDAFTGLSRNERAYKILDELGLKIMIHCDELVDVGTDIKDKRKEMIRNVQRVISKLESKVPATPNVGQNSNAMETSATIDDSLVNSKDHEILMKTSSPSTSPPKDTLSTGTAEHLIIA